jgi:hypothetical protein
MPKVSREKTGFLDQRCGEENITKTNLSNE